MRSREKAYMSPRGRIGSSITLALLWTLFMVAASSIPSVPRPAVPFLHYDKVFHFVEYGVFAWLWGNVLRSSRSLFLRRYAWIIVIVFGVAWGMMDEIYQGWIGRSRDIKDFLADAAGVCTIQLVQERRARKRKAA